MIEELHCLGMTGAGLRRVAQTERLEHGDAIGRDLQARPGLGQARRPLVDVHARPALGERGRGGEAADARPDDGDLPAGEAHGGLLPAQLCHGRKGD